MKDLPLIEATYTDLANVLDARLKDAQTRSDAIATAKLQKQQALHDAAYFVLAWGQFEAKINEDCVKAIIKRKSNVN